MTDTVRSAEPVPTASLPVPPLASSDLPSQLRGTDVPEAITDMLMLAKELAQATDYLPKNLRESPGNILAVMLQARALDIPLAVAWNELYMRGDNLGKSAKLQRALARRAGHRFRYIEHDKNHAVLLIQLKGESEPRRVVYTIAEAARMGYLDPVYDKKGNWRNQSERMLVARVTTRAVDMHCPEVALGLSADDELGDGFEISEDAVSAHLAEDKEKVAEYLRRAETLDCLGNGAARLKALRDLFVEANAHLEFAADDTGEYTVRRVLVEKMKEADQAAKRQAGGEPVPADTTPLEEAAQAVKQVRQRAPRKRAVKKPAEPAPEQASQEASQPDGQPAEEAPAKPARKRAPRKAVAKKTATAPVPAAPDPAPADPAPPAQQAPDVSGKPEDRVLECGCTPKDLIFKGGHRDTCKETAK